MKTYSNPKMMIEIHELDDVILSSTSPKLEAKNETLSGYNVWQEEL